MFLFAKYIISDWIWPWEFTALCDVVCLSDLLGCVFSFPQLSGLGLPFFLTHINPCPLPEYGRAFHEEGDLEVSWGSLGFRHFYQKPGLVMG
jgi:hypothetical protein